MHIKVPLNLRRPPLCLREPGTQKDKTAKDNTHFHTVLLIKSSGIACIKILNGNPTPGITRRDGPRLEGRLADEGRAIRDRVHAVVGRRLDIAGYINDFIVFDFQSEAIVPAKRVRAYELENVVKLFYVAVSCNYHWKP